MSIHSTTRVLTYAAIPKRVRANYSGGTHVQWPYLEEALGPYGLVGSVDGTPPQLEPEFQRGHVWNDAQRVAWLEYKLSGGHGSDLILWNEYPSGHHVLVDGLQRLTSVRMFMRDELRVFQGLDVDDRVGYLASEVEPRVFRNRMHLRFTVNHLPTEAAVVGWYLELNAGGTPHSEDEIARVRRMYEELQLVELARALDEAGLTVSKGHEDMMAVGDSKDSEEPAR